MAETIAVFDENEISRIVKLKRKMLYAYFVLLGLVVGAIITMMVVNAYKVNNFYDRSLQVPFTTLSIFLGVLFSAGSLFFFAIKFRLTSKYVRMLKDFKSGLKDTAIIEFCSFDDTTVFKDGVYFYTLNCKARPLGRSDITDRKILIEHTIKKPDFVEGQKIKAVTHANILTHYTIID